MSVEELIASVRALAEEGVLAAERERVDALVAAGADDPYALIELAKAVFDPAPSQAIGLAQRAHALAPDDEGIACELVFMLRRAGHHAESVATGAAYLSRAAPTPAALDQFEASLALASDVPAETLEPLLRRLAPSVLGGGDAGADAAFDVLAGRLLEAAPRAGEERIARLVVELLASSGTLGDLAPRLAGVATDPHAPAPLARRALERALQSPRFALDDGLVRAFLAAEPRLDWLEPSHLLGLLHRPGETPADARAEIAAAADRRFPGTPAIVIERAKAAAAAEDQAAAIRHAREANRLAPTDPGIAIELARLLVNAGETEAAVAALEGAAGPDAPPDLNLELARLQGLLGRHDAAEATVERAVAATPDHAPALLELVRLRERKGDLRDALGLVRRLAREAGPAAAPALVAEEARVLATLLRRTDPNAILPADHAALLALLDRHGADVGADQLWIVVDYAWRAEDEALFERALALAIASDRPDRASPVRAEIVRRVEGRPLDDVAGDRADPRATARGLAIAAAGRLAARNRMLARLGFALARFLDPDAQGAALALGFLALADGRLDAAREAFAAVGRAYPEEMSLVPWPVGPLPWPVGSWGLAATFAGEAPPGGWPRITVITPSFNQAAYVEETLLSVLHQEYPALEYIVVDGCSTDGTVDILERYRPRLAHLLVEPDEGQADAINKGLALATGEIVTWINSDDMLAPGALFAMARAFRETGADLVAGICLPFRGGSFEMANLPGVRQDTFTVEHLADLFRYWLKGYFFYQPEVFMGRGLLERLGMRLDVDLDYTMDYDLWMRAARAGARFDVVHWPIALFRHHREQKTAKLAECIFEQARLRDSYRPIAPAEDRRREVRARIDRAIGRPAPRVAVVSHRFAKIFSADMPRALREALAPKAWDVRLYSSIDEVRNADLAIVLVHLLGEGDGIERLRARLPDIPVVGWFWDNHHTPFENHRVAERLDVACAGHAFAAAYLANDAALSLAPVPLCVTQWSAREAAALFARHGDAPRGDDLYGGFVSYAFAPERDGLVSQLIEAGERGLALIPEADAGAGYFARSPEDRFRAWCGHKTSLVLPLADDVSQRLFDALLTGQVPVVPRDLPDLDRLFDAETAAALPMVAFGRRTVEDVRAAAAEAVAAFDREGTPGTLRRHAHALENHTFERRIETILQAVRGLVA